MNKRKLHLGLLGLCIFFVLQVHAQNMITLASGLSYTYDVAVDATGNIYVVDNREIKKMNANGGLISILADASILYHPTGIALDAAGNVYVADAGGNKILRINATDNSIYTYPIEFTAVADVAVDASGNIYLADKQSVKKINSSGTGFTTLGDGFSWPESTPGGLAIDAAGNIFVTDMHQGKILKINPSGTTTTIASGLITPSAISTDAAGNVYAAAQLGTVKRMDANGNNSISIGNTLYNPKGLTVDANGNIYIADADNSNSTIRKIIMAPTPDNNNILYVDANVAGGLQIGNNWANAIPKLADALKWARQQDNFTAANPLNIYVAEGSYYPTGSQNGADRNATFLIPQHGSIKMYGGFPTGGGIRNIKDNPTILSGDIGTPGSKTDNSYHVMVMTNIPASAGSVVIDGFTIRDGNADGVGSPYIYNGSETNQNEGGGILLRLNNNTSKVAISNCIITDNAASANAGGIYLWQTAPTMVNNLVAHNTTAGNGGGLFLYETPGLLLINSTVVNNTAAGNGNSIYNTGASSIKIANSILWSNNAAKNVYNDATLIVNYSDLQQASGTYTGMGNINTDPLFTDPSARDYSLSNTSPAMNKGSNALFLDLDGNTKDLAGNARLTGTTIDMGAYESLNGALPVNFGSFSAVIKGGQLFVTWTTESETNNDHFLLLLSADGRNWKTVETVQSKAAAGNSDIELKYSIAIPFTALSLGAGFLLIGIIAARKRKYVFITAAIVCAALYFSCNKKDFLKDIDNQKLFVRIVQVDKDGTKSYSKVVQAVSE